MNPEAPSLTVVLLDGPGKPRTVPGIAPDRQRLSWRRQGDQAAFLAALLEGTANVAVIDETATGDLTALMALVREVARDVPIVILGDPGPGCVATVARLTTGADALLPTMIGEADLAAVLTAVAGRAGRARQADAEARDLQGRLRTEQARSRRFHQRLRELVHEVGTSGTILAGYTSNLLDGIDGPLDDAQRRSLERMRVASEVLAGVLAKTREESDRDRPPAPGALADARTRQRTRLRPGALATEAADLLERAFQERNVSLETQEDPGCPVIWGDRLRLLQVLLALLDNALRHTPRLGRVRVLSEAAPAGTFPDGRPGVRLVVEDTGPGVPVEDRQRIFLPGVSNPGEDGRKHSGLGLVVCREVAGEHGGRIAVQETQGGGASFRLDLPVDPRGRRGSLKITVVDDPVLAGQVLMEVAQGGGSVIVRRAECLEDLLDAAPPEGTPWLVAAPPGSALDRVVARLEKGAD
jgi:signal transduction histidine kinase